MGVEVLEPVGLEGLLDCELDELLGFVGEELFVVEELDEGDVGAVALDCVGLVPDVAGDCVGALGVVWELGEVGELDEDDMEFVGELVGDEVVGEEVVGADADEDELEEDADGDELEGAAPDVAPPLPPPDPPAPPPPPPPACAWTAAAPKVVMAAAMATWLYLRKFLMTESFGDARVIRICGPTARICTPSALMAVGRVLPDFSRLGIWSTFADQTLK